jgi:acetyl-CoA carboxylase carboxyl transferase subunit alpha
MAKVKNKSEAGTNASAAVEVRTAFERVQLARHPDRPYTLDFVERLFDEFIELHGDRRFADDPAIVCGYRKALRAMKLAEKFGRPIFTLIDTPGAYPGIDAEERGQAEAIAYNLREMAKLRVPVIVTVIGEGGSGGALAIGIGDQVLMLENAIYSVISPEGCAAILWKDAKLADRAAEGLRLTAQNLYEEKIVDQIIPEPPGGAHIDYDQTARFLDSALSARLAEAVSCSQQERLSRRHDKLRQFGRWGIA